MYIIIGIVNKDRYSAFIVGDEGVKEHGDTNNDRFAAATYNEALRFVKNHCREQDSDGNTFAYNIVMLDARMAAGSIVPVIPHGRIESL